MSLHVLPHSFPPRRSSDRWLTDSRRAGGGASIVLGGALDFAALGIPFAQSLGEAAGRAVGTARRATVRAADAGDILVVILDRRAPGPAAIRIFLQGLLAPLLGDAQALGFGLFRATTHVVARAFGA